MAKIKRRKEEGSPLPSLEYFFRGYYLSRWHVGVRLPNGMRTRCGKLLNGRVLVRPAGGMEKCEKCFGTSTRLVNTTTTEEWNFDE